MGNYNFSLVIDDIKIKSKEIEDNFKKEIQINTIGKININWIKNLKVEYYGSKIEIGNIAKITVLKANKIKIIPYDKNKNKLFLESLLEKHKVSLRQLRIKYLNQLKHEKNNFSEDNFYYYHDEIDKIIKKEILNLEENLKVSLNH